MKEIIFIADFATKKKGDVWKCDGMLASQLINVDKVAKLNTPEKAKETKKDTDKTGK